MKKTVLIWMLIHYALPDYSQNFNWVKQAGGIENDESYCVEFDFMGNSFVTGSYSGTATFGTFTLSSSGNEDMFLAAYDAAGNVSWAYGGSGAGIQSGHVLAVDVLGNIYVAGEFENSITFGPFTLNSNGSTDVFVFKVNSAGVVQWAFNMGGTGFEFVNSIGADVSGNIYFTGTFENSINIGATTITSAGMSDFYAAKLNPIGALQWLIRGGGISEDESKGLAVDINSEICITGNFQDVSSFGTFALSAAGAGKEIFIAKVSTSGNFLWAIKAGSSQNDISYEADADGFGNFFIAGTFRGSAVFGSFNISSAGEDDIFLAKVSPSGTIMWAAAYGGAGSDRGYAVACTPSNDVVITGSFENSFSIGSSNLSSAGDKDIFIASVSTNAAPQWALNAGGPGFDRGYGIDINTSGSVWVTGSFEQNATFGTFNLSSSGMRDLFLANIEAATSIFEPATEFSFELFPNPATDFFIINVNDYCPYAEIEIFSSGGSLLHSEILHQPYEKITLPAKISGYNMAKIKCGKSSTAKILIIH